MFFRRIIRIIAPIVIFVICQVQFFQSKPSDAEVGTSTNEVNDDMDNSNIALNGSDPFPIPDEDIVITKVLIARTVSASEAENSVADAVRLLSYREPKNARSYYAKSLSRCNLLRETPAPDPGFVNGSDTFPSQIACHVANSKNNNNSTKKMLQNGYASVQADFLFFARNGEVAKDLFANLLELEIDDNVEILDVSALSIKITNWLAHLDEKKLQGYDYVWMVDGDIEISSLNWHSYWQQVLLLKPRISAPVIIKGQSDHLILRHQWDSRQIAAETAIIELGSPCFEVGTWLGYRNVVRNDTALVQLLQSGGEDCFDLAWCHYARTNFTGHQEWPQKNLQGYNPHRPAFTDVNGKISVGGFDRRSCVVFYQSAVVHASFSTMGKTREFRRAGQELCRHLKRNYHVTFAVRSVYELFMAAMYNLG